MDCDEFRNLVERRLQRKLRWWRVRRFDEHALHCEQCARYLQRAEIAWEAATELIIEAPIPRIANTILQQAIRDNASEVRVEPRNDGLQVRCGSGGEFVEMMPLPGYISIPLLARFKAMANLDVHQDAQVQEGCISLRLDKQDYQVRLRTIPGATGEGLVMEFS